MPLSLAAVTVCVLYTVEIDLPTQWILNLLRGDRECGAHPLLQLDLVGRDLQHLHQRSHYRQRVTFSISVGANSALENTKPSHVRNVCISVYTQKHIFTDICLPVGVNISFL
jgi:hypothetical protein